MPRTFNYIFNKIKKSTANNSNDNKDKDNNENLSEKNNNKNTYRYNISLAFVQLYLESIQDLLDPESKDIRIREDPEKGVYLEGVQWFQCESPEECAEIFHKGELHRNTECTKMNAHSSRSHAILIIKIEKSIKITNPKNIKNIKNTDRLLTCSYLNLVDLAGSERVRKTGATDMRLEEAKKINLSLLCLGNVISSLTNPNANHISYRDSKLTRLLKESLGGNAKTSLIVTVSPSTFNTEETMSSLYFALRAMKVKNKPTINKTIDYQVLCIKLQDDLDKLNDDYAKLKMEYDKVSEELEKYKKGEQYLELQKKAGLSGDISLQFISSDNNSSINDTNDSTSNKNSIESGNNSKKDIRKSKSKIDLTKDKSQIKKIKKFYENLMQKKAEEYENILRKVDDLVYSKEKEIEDLNAEINELNYKLKKQKEDLDDMSKEKEDLQNSVSTLSAQVEDQKKLIKNDKTEKEYKALIEILNDNISALEKKILKLEDTSVFSETSAEKLNNLVDFKINQFQSQINNLTQKKNNATIKKAQNEIKINLISAGKNCDYKSNEKINEEIMGIQKENFELLIDQDSIARSVEIIEKKIKSAEKISQNLTNLIEKCKKMNKNELIMSLAQKEIDSIISEESVQAYDNILLKSIESQYNNKFKFNIYKVENDLNSLINKSSLLLNNYLNHINKLDDINKELDTIINQPDNFDKLNQMRENLQLLIEDSEEINNINKEYNKHQETAKNLNTNIPYDKCPPALDNIITSMSENFLSLIETYNATNSNICQLISLMEESFCYKKKFITNFSSFVQESVGDSFTRQNILYKLNELLKKDFVDENEYSNKMEEIIEELYKKISTNLKEKEKENKSLNDRINLYMRQIDENVKKTILKKTYTNRNTLNVSTVVPDAEVKKLKQRIISQQNTISNTKSKIDKMNMSFNKVNELIKSTNFGNNKMNSNKIVNALEECKNAVKNISKGLDPEVNKETANKICQRINASNINETLRKSLQKDNLINAKNTKDKKFPQKIFKQYLINLSKFSKTVSEYALNEDDKETNFDK